MEFQSIPALCTFFFADLTEEMKAAIKEYQGMDSITLSVCSSPYYPFIPNSLRRNLFLFALSEMPQVKGKSLQPSFEETEQAVSALLHDNETGLNTICEFLKKHPSPFIKSLNPFVMGEYLFDCEYCVVSYSVIDL